MTAENHPPTRSGETTYNLTVLPALGGCFLYVTRHGEAVGLYHGVNEKAAVENAAAGLTATMTARHAR